MTIKSEFFFATVCVIKAISAVVFIHVEPVVLPRRTTLTGAASKRARSF
jgi:hypothetical protein